jgi:tight adherence protein C
MKKEYSSEEEQARAKANCVLIPTKGTQYTEHKKGSNEEQKFKETSNALFYAPLVLIFVAIFLIVRVFMEDQDKYKTQEALEEAEATTKPKNSALFLRITRPFYKRYFLPIVQSSKHKQNFRTKYRQKLANGGLMKEMSPEEFVALKFFMILGGPFAYLCVRYVTDADWPVSITPVMGIVGFFYPDVWLSGMIKRRADDTLRAMPFIVDMLALSVEAGLDFMAAMQRVIEKAPPSPLVEEFETLIKETKIGSSRAEGLRQLGWRVNIIEINSFCATLIAADSVGASIAPLLKQLSAELRVKRSSRAEQLGATAATKILIPMIFFILPAVLVAIFAPMVLKFVSGKL